MATKTIEGYELEETRSPDGKTVWVATDPAVPGPYAMGDTAAEALDALKKTIGYWHEEDTDGSETASLSSGEATVSGDEGRVWYAGDGWRA